MFDNEIHLQGRTRVLRGRESKHLALHVLWREGKPILGFVFPKPRRECLRILGRFLTLGKRYLVADGNLVRGNINCLAVHRNKAVAYDLAALGAARAKPQTVDDIVQPQLQILQKRVAGDPSFFAASFDISAKLALIHEIHPLGLLLGQKLGRILGTAPARLPVHAGRVAAFGEILEVFVAQSLAEASCEPSFGASASHPLPFGCVNCDNHNF